MHDFLLIEGLMLKFEEKNSRLIQVPATLLLFYHQPFYIYKYAF